MAWTFAELAKHCSDIHNLKTVNGRTVVTAPLVKREVDRIEAFLQVLEGEACAFSWDGVNCAFTATEMVRHYMDNRLITVKETLAANDLSLPLKQRLRDAFLVLFGRAEAMVWKTK